MCVSSKASGGTFTFCGAAALPPEELEELEDELEELDEDDDVPPEEELLELDEELEDELDEELDEELLDDELELDELEELDELLELEDEPDAVGPIEHQAELLKLLDGNSAGSQVKLPVSVAYTKEPDLPRATEWVPLMLQVPPTCAHFV